MRSNAVPTKRITTKKVVYCGFFIAISIVLKLLFEIYVPIGGFPSLRLNLNSVPIILSGIAMGPGYGFVVGVLSDLICYVVKPNGPLFLGFTLSSGLTGLIPGLLYIVLKKDNSKFLNWFNLIFAIICFGYLFGTQTISFNNGSFYYLEDPLNPFIIAFFFILVALFALYPFIASFFIKKSNVENSETILFAITIEQIINSIILNTLWLTILYGQAWTVLLPARVITNLFLIPVYTILVVAVLKIIPRKM